MTMTDLLALALLITITIGAAKILPATAKKDPRLVLAVLAMVLIPVMLAGCTGTGSKTTTPDRPDQTQTMPIAPAPGPGGDTLTVHFIDVGQADAILLEFPSGQTMLIDGGNNNDGDLVVNYIKKQGIRLIDHVIGTHPHQDHIGGLVTVLNNITVDRIYMPKVIHNTNTYRDLLLTIKKKGLKVTEAKAGLELEVGSGVQTVMLAPGGGDYEQLNDYSVVLKVTYGDTGFLFTGDAEALAEKEMLDAGYDLKANVLKVAHHGSSSSTTKAFLKAVAPQYAVITAGENNDYGHPHAEVLDRLESAAVQVFRTDLAGTVIATSDGETIVLEKPSKTNNLETINIEITSIDLINEVVMIKNTGQVPVDLAGWQLVSTRGDQKLIFPRETILPPGSILKVVSGPKAQPGPATLVWTKDYIWNNDGDPGLLYNATGKIISKYPR